MRSSFVLDEGCTAQLVERMQVAARWIEFPHLKQRERGLVMLAGECLRLPTMRVPSEPVLWLHCVRGLPTISQDGLDVEVWGWHGTDTGRLLLSLRLENQQPDASRRQALIDLPVPVGGELLLELRCLAGPQGRSEADWSGGVRA